MKFPGGSLYFFVGQCAVPLKFPGKTQADLLLVVLRGCGEVEAYMRTPSSLVAALGSHASGLVHMTILMRLFRIYKYLETSGFPPFFHHDNQTKVAALHRKLC